MKATEDVGESCFLLCLRYTIGLLLLLVWITPHGVTGGVQRLQGPVLQSAMNLDGCWIRDASRNAFQPLLVQQ